MSGEDSISTAPGGSPDSLTLRARQQRQPKIMQTPLTARAGGPVVSNSLGFYWPVLSAAGPGGSLDLGRMCPLPEPNTLAKYFQTKGRDIFSHGLLGPPERGTGQSTQEVRKKQRKS